MRSSFLLDLKLLKNNEMAERLKNCVTSLDALNNDMKKLDAVFESVESRLNAFVQSENIETVDADRSTLEELLEDLNKYILIRNIIRYIIFHSEAVQFILLNSEVHCYYRRLKMLCND